MNKYKVLFITVYKDQSVSSVVTDFDNKKHVDAAIKAAKQHLKDNDRGITIECIRLY